MGVPIPAGAAAAAVVAAAAEAVLHDVQEGPRLCPASHPYVTRDYLGAQIGRDVKTVSKNTKILSHIMLQLFLHIPSNSQFINRPEAIRYELRTTPFNEPLIY